MTVRLLTVLVVGLALAAPAAASEQHPTLPELERELICPACHETLAASSSAIADRIRAFVRQRIAAGDTKSEIKAKLVDQFGEAVLAAPPKSGFNLLAWVLPLAGIALAAAIVGAFAYRWSRRRHGSATGDPSTNGRFHLDPELERRLDEELARYDG
ncbi:MAG TPA: cytochrome c-type biogenesis protein CcmH [Gaiellaceae bacterium]|nr:cytochrome c-type biogenesis protein CcmH [Gaiellaceae bacterium]